MDPSTQSSPREKAKCGDYFPLTCTIAIHILRENMNLLSKKLCLAVSLVACLGRISTAENARFDGLEKAMDPATYEKAGLRKLTPGERAALNDFIRDYVGAKQKDAAAVAAADAVDRAVKERKVTAPEVIESKIVGIFKGWGPRTFFHLENGQTWKPTNDDVVPYSPIEGPNVVIFRDMFGYKMFVGGASIVRVKRVN